MTWDRVSVFAAILSNTHLKCAVSLLPSLSACVVISHAAVVQFVSLCSGMRCVGLWHSAMIRVRFFIAPFLRSRKLYSSDLM